MNFMHFVVVFYSLFFVISHRLVFFSIILMFYGFVNEFDPNDATLVLPSMQIPSMQF